MALKLGQILVTQLQLKNGFVFMTGRTPPIDGETGANTAGPASLYAYCADDAGALYLNVGTRAEPRWKRLLTTDP